jgi:hypothetical protein
MNVIKKTETLTDLSKVYNLHLYGDSGGHIVLHCVTESDADELAAKLVSVIEAHANETVDVTAD